MYNPKLLIYPPTPTKEGMCQGSCEIQVAHSWVTADFRGDSLEKTSLSPGHNLKLGFLSLRESLNSVPANIKVSCKFSSCQRNLKKSKSTAYPFHSSLRPQPDSALQCPPCSTGAPEPAGLTVVIPLASVSNLSKCQPHSHILHKISKREWTLLVRVTSQASAWLSKNSTESTIILVVSIKKTKHHPVTLSKSSCTAE